MPADLDFWHQRYLQQVGWTLEVRRYIFNKIGVSSAEPILEVGSGTGALISSLLYDGYTQITGIDLDLASLQKAKFNNSACADAHQLPFSPGTFSLAICHFLLLWVRDPRVALEEMFLTVRFQGWVVALAEPDYTRRIDQPQDLAPLGAAQTESLSGRGVDISIGSRLADLFRLAGLRNVETGIIQPRQSNLFTEDEFKKEWAVLRRDLAGRVPEDQIRRWYDLDRLAAIRGERRHFVPTHFAFGQK